MREYLKNFFAAERAKLKDMTFKEKASYIWEYYKIPIIAAIVVLIIAGNIINTVWIHPPKKIYLQIAFYGQYIDDNAITAMCSQLGGGLMTPEELQTMEITGSSFMVNSGDAQMDMAYQQKFSAMIAAREIDLFVVSQTDLNTWAAQGMLSSIKDFLPDALFSKVSDKLVEAADENGVKADYAIKLDGNKLFGDNGLPADGLCIGAVINTQRQDNVKRALDFIFKSIRTTTAAVPQRLHS